MVAYVMSASQSSRVTQVKGTDMCRSREQAAVAADHVWHCPANKEHQQTCTCVLMKAHRDSAYYGIAGTCWWNRSACAYWYGDLSQQSTCLYLYQNNN